MGHHTPLHTIKLVPIYNSKDVRNPSKLSKKSGFQSTLVLKETDRGLFLHGKKDVKLTWEETFQAMAEAKEPWDDFETDSRMG